MKNLTRWFVGLTLSLVLTPTNSLTAQERVVAGKRLLLGIVRDAAGAALEGATVAVPGASVRTDVRGAFVLHAVDFDTVTISIKRLGFEPIEALLTARSKVWDTVHVQLDPAVTTLKDVKVTENLTRASLAMRSFEERKARGIGTFITRAEIVERGSSRLSDLMRTKRGVLVQKGGKVRFVAFSGGRSQACQPDIWLDGSRSKGMELDDLPPNTVELMELYPNLSSVPMEFQSFGANTTPCGTIVVWTRIPNGKAP